MKFTLDILVKDVAEKALDEIIYEGKTIREWVEIIVKQQPCEDWYDMPSDEMTLEQARQAVKDLRKKLAKYLEQEPKTGHWSRKTKVDAYDIKGVKTWGIKCQCDRCCFTTIAVEDFGYYKYCPNCGAEMEMEGEKC